MGITKKQKEFVNVYLLSSSIEEACQKVNISRRTFYNWMKDKEFERFLRDKVEEITQEGLEKVRLSITKAINNLISLLDTENEGLRRLVCKDIIEYAIKAREIDKPDIFDDPLEKWKDIKW